MLMTTANVSRPKTRRGHPQTNPNSLANLIPYQKGQNGHGRVYPLKERLQHALDHPLKVPKPDAPHGDVIVYNTLKGAAELVPVAFRETWDRVEGKVPEPPKAQPEQQGNRIINIFVGTDKAKQMIEGLTGRLLQQDIVNESPPLEG